MMRKRILILVVLAAMLLFCVPSYAAEIHFDLVRTEVETYEPFYDLEVGGVNSAAQPDYTWPESIPIPVVQAFPEPNIIDLGNEYSPDYAPKVNGYITQIDGEYYWAGRTGERWGPLPTVPLGTSVPETLTIPDKDWRPDVYPFNAIDKEIVHEESVFDKELNLLRRPGRIGKWVFGWDDANEKTKIFVDGIYGVETDISFKVLGADTIHGYDKGVVYWEDEDTFYIKNYNLLLSTPKQPLYEALDALEEAPVVKVNDTILGFETPPVTESDRTLVPMRFLFEQLGAEVTWDEATETATAVKANTTINFSIDNTTATVNGAETVMDVPARLVGDKTMVPLRFLSEEMGYTVEWDEETRMATITTPLMSRVAEAEDTDVFGEWLR